LSFIRAFSFVNCQFALEAIVDLDFAVLAEIELSRGYGAINNANEQNAASQSDFGRSSGGFKPDLRPHAWPRLPAQWPAIKAPSRGNSEVLARQVLLGKHANVMRPEGGMFVGGICWNIERSMDCHLKMIWKTAILCNAVPQWGIASQPSKIFLAGGPTWAPLTESLVPEVSGAFLKSSANALLVSRFPRTTTSSVLGVSVVESRGFSSVISRLD
jgi:hypothetical protein